MFYYGVYSSEIFRGTVNLLLHCNIKFKERNIFCDINIKKELLKIICCPITKEPLQIIDKDLLERLNQLIVKGALKNEEGEVQKNEIQEALITTDKKRIYLIRDGIPVLMSNLSINISQARVK